MSLSKGLSRLSASRKGGLSLSLWTLIDIFILALMVIALFYQVYMVSKSSWFEKRYVAKDVALMTDAIYASPYDVTAVYPHDTFWFSFHFEKGKITVYDIDEHGKITRSGIATYFSENSKIAFTYKELTPSAVRNSGSFGDINAHTSYVPLVIEKKGAVIEPTMKISAGSIE